MNATERPTGTNGVEGVVEQSWCRVEGAGRTESVYLVPIG